MQRFLSVVMWYLLYVLSYLLMSYAVFRMVTFKFV